MEEGSAPVAGARQGLRGLALLVGCLLFSVGNPIPLVMLPLALMGLFLSAPSSRGALVGGGLLALGLLGGGIGGLADLDRGWALLLGGSFVSVTLGSASLSLMERMLRAVGMALAGSAVLLGFSGGWPAVDALMAARIDAGSAATLEFGASVLGWEAGSPFGEAARRTGEVQKLLFPAQLALASLLGLGAAWWMGERILQGRTETFGPFRAFRFPDALIWVLIGGLATIALFGGVQGWGRVGANLAFFAGVLYALRGVAVFLALSGGLKWSGWILAVLGFLLAAPVLLTGAMLAGLGDTWLDLRSRGQGAAPGPPSE
jgi:hypothetical protein